MNEPKQSNELIDEATALQKSQPDPVSPQPIQPVELLRLLRDPQSGQLIVQIGAQRYTKLSDVADKKIGQYILKLVAHLLVFTNGMIVTEAGLKSVYQPKAGDLPEPPIIHLSEPLGPISSQTPDPQEPAAGPLVPKPPPEAEAAFLASLRVRKPPEPESSTLPGGLFGRSKPAAPPPTLPTLNLAKEINDIVQARLMIAPLSTASKVEVLSARDGGIQIHVDGRFYASPDDIPDPEVKALIKASIKQWERS